MQRPMFGAIGMMARSGAMAAMLAAAVFGVGGRAIGAPRAAESAQAKDAAPGATVSAPVIAAAAPAKAIPSSRAAKNIAVIPIVGPIDRYTAHSVARRIETAQRAGANAVVFEINTPGGELQATLAICRTIKSSPIANTVAWINPDAYSAGAIIALACREMVVSETATMGDALPITGDPLRGLQALPDAEREKMLGPLMTEVVDSARRNGYDELLVQGLVRRGVELWLVEHRETGKRLFVNEVQYRAAVGEADPQTAEPDRTASPSVPSATGKGAGPLAPISPPRVGGAEVGPESAEATGFIPAAPGISAELAEEVNDALSMTGTPSARPDLRDAAQRGQYRPVEYVSDGHGLIVLKAPLMLRYGIAKEAVSTDEELKAFFGASTVQRLPVTWSEGLVRFLTNPIVRGVLIVIFLVSLFVEMTHPGATLPGIIAVAALLTLIIPPTLIDMASWWEVLAIVLGIVLMAVEVFILPGFGVCGVLGLVLLFGGLIGTFVGQGSGLFPNTPQQTKDLTWGVSTVLVALLTSGVALGFLWRSLPNLPILGKLIHQDSLGKRGEDESEDLLIAMDEAGDAEVRAGEEGVALSPLRPSGRAQFGERIVDAHAESGMIQPGVRVRVLRVEGLRIVVDRV